MKKAAGLAILISVSCLAATFPSLADVISDVPFGVEATAGESGTTAAPPVNNTAAPPVSNAAPPASTSNPPPAASSETVAAASSDGAVIGDAPDSSGASASGTQAPAVPAASAASSAATGSETAGQAPPPSGSSTASSGQAAQQAPAAASAETAAPAAASSASTTAGPGGASVSAGQTVGPGGSIAPATDSAADGAPGSAYNNVPKIRVDLGYTLISPNYDYNGYKVAEGSVQLSDGSWQTVGHDQYIRQPYFRLLREDGDWYVVAATATRIGNASTNDGSVVREIWLKKSDCRAQNYIELNVSDSRRQQIIKTALSYLGKGYQYAGNGPDAFDCSGFVHTVLGAAGVSIARSSYEIINTGTPVGITGLRPGDIVGRPGHVGIYIGDGYFVHAAESSAGVITESLEIYNRTHKFTSYNNVLGD